LSTNVIRMIKIRETGVDMLEQDFDKIGELVKEGKHISKIQKDKFPQYDYRTVYCAVVQHEQRSSIGLKREITNRVKKLSKSNLRRDERISLCNEIDDRVEKLYRNYKTSFDKLQKIRDGLFKD
jgi:hypothetical protein